MTTKKKPTAPIDEKNLSPELTEGKTLSPALINVIVENQLAVSKQHLEAVSEKITRLENELKDEQERAAGLEDEISTMEAYLTKDGE